MPPDPPRRGEFSLIAELLAPLSAGDPRSVGLTDDAAILPPRPGFDTVVTTDTMVEGVHFLADEAAAAIARRLLRVNLSDVAAMGAEPFAYFLNLTLSDRPDDRWLEEFVSGLRDDQKRYGVVLLGGDTTRTPGVLTLSITALGSVPSGEAVKRGGARPGDVVMVSGTIGDAALGLEALQSGRTGEDAAALIARFQLPEPRLRLASGLRKIATAMADVSDGLVADLGHIAEASGLGATIDGPAVPRSPAAQAALDAGETDLGRLLTGGDDYELVFTVPPDRVDAALAAAEAAGEVRVTEIGRMAAAAGPVVVRGPDGRPLALGRTGFRHF